MTAASDAREQAVLAALQARGRFGIHLGLGRVRALLRALGDPHAGLRGALIAGTNGKGSVQALAASMLGAAGYRVGQTPKPHLVAYRERIVVGGRPIESGDLAALLEETIRVADRLAPRLGPPTEFEVLTAAAFAWFARSRVDVAVVEVGMGGRLDATNVWDGGVAAITNVDLDHMEHLGPTIPAIARQKAGIIKRGDLAVTAATGDALAVVRRRARRMGVPLEVVAPFPVRSLDRDGIVLAAPGLGDVRVGLIGRHQAANVAVALGVVDALERAGIATVSREARIEGLRGARWPGRMELIRLGGAAVRSPAAPPGRAARNPAAPARRAARATVGTRAAVDVLLDGAHNPAGVRALLAALDELRPLLAAGPIVLLTGVMSDKDVEGMVAELAAHEVLRDARVVATRVDPARGLPAAALRDTWLAVAPGADVRAVEPTDAAIDAALDAVGGGGTMIVAGSLYLVGAVRGRLEAEGEVPA